MNLTQLVEAADMAGSFVRIKQNGGQVPQPGVPAYAHIDSIDSDTVDLMLVGDAVYPSPATVDSVEMSFSAALAALKDGQRVARAGWNGKGMFLFLVPGSRFQVNRPPLLGIYEEGTTVDYHAHIDMKTAQGYVVPWLASQADMLADDWMIVE